MILKGHTMNIYSGTMCQILSLTFNDKIATKGETSKLYICSHQYAAEVCDER